MSDWKPGDVANGHVLGEDLVWRPLGSDEARAHARGGRKDWWLGRTEEQKARKADARAQFTGALSQLSGGRAATPTGYDWPDTHMPLNSRKVGQKATDAIKRQCLDGKDPWLIVAPGGGMGLLAAWDDRVSVIKTGAWTSLMAGSLGGERAATFHFMDITGVEYNSGLINGVLEILTPSYSGGTPKDYWQSGSNDPWKQSNTLPLVKTDYNKALDDINELRSRIGQVKSGRNAPMVEQPSPTAAAEEIRSLAELRDQGILTDEEFNAKKRQILGL